VYTTVPTGADDSVVLSVLADLQQRRTDQRLAKKPLALLVAEELVVLYDRILARLLKREEYPGS